ncbi:MAG TPA: hypothetical protein V6C63_14940 [Allocoleopsis sp.]
MEPLKTFLEFVLLANALEPGVVSGELNATISADAKVPEAPNLGAIADQSRV